MKCTLKRLVPWFVLAAIILLAFILIQPKKHRDPNVPEPTPVTPPPVAPEPTAPTWTSVDSGYGWCTIEPWYWESLDIDKEKAEGGWRIFKSSEGDYKIIYSVDEWVLICKSTDDGVGTLSKEDGTVVGIYPPGYVDAVAPPQPGREPWWMYYNKRTKVIHYVYGEQRPDCPDGNCPLTRSVDGSEHPNSNPQDSGRQPVRSLLPGRRK